MTDRDELVRRLRGAVGNAVVWGAGWAALGLAVFVGLKATGALPARVHWLDGLVIAARAGFMGGIASAAFSAVIGVAYRGRRLSEISWARFGLGGAVVTGVFVPVFMQTMNLLSGDGFVPMGLVLDDVPWTALFGGAVAAVSLKLAQRAEPLLSGGRADAFGLLRGADPLASAGDWDAGRHHAPIRRNAAE